MLKNCLDTGVQFMYFEKLIEHYIAYELLNLHGLKEKDIYIDVAAASSPWAKILREKLKIQSYAIDLDIHEEFENINYYMKQDATHTSFPPSSVKGVSLQCAYEMFLKEDDILLIGELARILMKGGKAIILPLYMHTHSCSYSSYDRFGQGHSDEDSKEYIYYKYSGTYSSRKYDVPKLKKRILKKITDCGLGYKIYILRNKNAINPQVYCHFILEIYKPD